MKDYISNTNNDHNNSNSEDDLYNRRYIEHRGEIKRTFYRNKNGKVTNKPILSSGNNYEFKQREYAQTNQSAQANTNFDQQSRYKNYLQEHRYFRIKRLSKILIYATKTNASYRSRLIVAYKRRLIRFITSGLRNKIRYASALFAVVFVFSALYLPFLDANWDRELHLDDKVLALVGETRDDSKDYLKYDTKNKKYDFVVEKTDEAEGASEHVGRIEDAYSMTLPDNAKDGVTITEKNTKISVTLIPEFFTTKSKKSQGDHLVYQSGSRLLVYTLKYNGLKEDIIIPEFQGDELSFKFKLNLPTGVEPRIDSEGNIGIYSADTTLYGDISFGTDGDRDKIDKAREKGEKNNLVMTIPYPVVIDAKGNEFKDKAKFELGDKTTKKVQAQQNNNLPEEVQKGLPSSMASVNEYPLTLSGRKLTNLSYPISIDPTIRMGSSADFSNMLNEDNTEIDNSGALIKRSTLSGGTIPTPTSQTPSWGQRAFAGGFAYDGRLFYLGGNGSNTIWYVAIANDGTIGPFWTQSASVVPGTNYNGYGTTLMNGYLYLLGGQDNGSVIPNTKYIKIDKLISTTTGTTFSDGPNLPNASAIPGAASYNGYIYALGGRFTSTTNLWDVYYSKINADGSPSAFSTSVNNMNTKRWQLAAFAYNGRLYYGGGCRTSGGAISSDCATVESDVWSAPINSSTGDIGAFVQTSSFSVARGGLSMVATKGYVYMTGGCVPTVTACDSGTVRSDVQFAQINSNGSLGTWSTTNPLANARYGAASAFYQGNIYFMGGCNISSNTTCVQSSSNQLKNVEYAKVSVAGSNRVASTTGSQTGRLNHATAVSDGFVYVMGGCTTTTCKDSDGVGQGYNKTVQYAPFNNDGTIGTWTTTQNIPATGTSKAGRMDFAAVIRGGYLYIIGGYACNALCNGEDYKNDILVGKLNIGGGGGIISGGMTLGGCAVQSFCPATNNMTTVRSRHSAVTHGGYLYIMGGNNGTSTLATGMYADYKTDGSGDLNAFTVSTSMNNIRDYFVLVEYNGKLYAIGGYVSGVSRTDNERADITSGGSLSSWTLMSGASDLPAARSAAGGVMVNGRLYIMGGGNGDNNVQSTVYIGDFASNGNISGWTTNTLPLSVARASAGNPGVYSNGYIYFISGCSSISSNQCNTFQGNAERSQINNGGPGSANTPVAASFNLATARASPAVVVVNNYIYVIAGCIDTFGGCTTATNTVERNSFAANGDYAGAWTSVTSISNSIFNHTAVAHNGYIYVIGGDLVGSAIATVEYTKVKSDGTFEAPSVACGASIWCSTGAANLPSVRQGHASIVYKSRIYTVGGNGTSTAVLFININADGTLQGASWTTTTSFNIGRSAPNVTAQNDFLYIVGSTGGSQFAPIVPSTGHVGTWVITNAQTRPQSNGGTIVLNGYIYSIAGTDGADTSLIQMAPLYSGGRIGTFTFSPIKLLVARVNTSVIYYNGRVYVVAGNTGPTLRATSEYFSVQSIPRIGSFSKAFDFDVGVKPTKLITRGNKQPSAVVSVNYSNNVACGATAYDQDQTVSDTGYGGVNAQSFNLGTSRTLARCLYLRYTIDDSLSAVFPDSGNETSISSFDIYYTANPGNRLRGGRTFTNGADRGLDVPF